MQSQQITKIFTCGTFEKHNNSFLEETKEALTSLASVAKKYNKLDMDTLLNEFHDSYIGRALGFDKVNTFKRGFDCSCEDGRYLESKVSSASSSTYSATFNDTTIEKARAFKDKRVWLAYSIWEDPATPVCVVFGQNEKIGDYIEEMVKKHEEKRTKRSTQTVSLNSLLFKYGFKIFSLGKSKEEIAKFFQTHGKGRVKKITENDIFDLTAM